MEKKDVDVPAFQLFLIAVDQIGLHSGYTNSQNKKPNR